MTERVAKIDADNPYQFFHDRIHFLVDAKDVFEEVVRCSECDAYVPNATPHDDGGDFAFCTRLRVDMRNGCGFCSWGRREGDSADLAMPKTVEDEVERLLTSPLNERCRHCWGVDYAICDVDCRKHVTEWVTSHFSDHDVR